MGKSHPSWDSHLKMREGYNQDVEDIIWADETFCWRVGDVFGAFFAAAASRRILKTRWTLKNGTSLLHTRKLLSIALAFDARIFRECHLALLEYILAVQVAPCKKYQKCLLSRCQFWVRIKVKNKNDKLSSGFEKQNKSQKRARTCLSTRYKTRNYSMVTIKP